MPARIGYRTEWLASEPGREEHIGNSDAAVSRDEQISDGRLARQREFSSFYNFFAGANQACCAAVIVARVIESRPFFVAIFERQMDLDQADTQTERRRIRKRQCRRRLVTRNFTEAMCRSVRRRI